MCVYSINYMIHCNDQVLNILKSKYFLNDVKVLQYNSNNNNIWYINSEIKYKMIIYYY